MSEFIIVALAVWRISHMLVHEDGPWEIFHLIRMRFNGTSMGPLMDCVGCVSMWVAIPAAFLPGMPLGWMRVPSWLAISAITVLMNGIVRKVENFH